MRKITLTEEQINYIKKMLKENMTPTNEPLGSFQEMIEAKMAETNNQIESLKNQLESFNMVIPSFNKFNEILREYYPNVQGPIKDGHDGWFKFIFPQGVPNTEDMDFEGIVGEAFPEIIRDAVDVYPQTDESMENVIGIRLIIDLDDIKGWY